MIEFSVVLSQNHLLCWQKKPQKDEILSVGCTLWNLYLDLWTDWSCISYICGAVWFIAEESKLDCYGWEQIVICVNCGFQDHTQSEPLMWTSRTHAVTHANPHKSSITLSCVCFWFFFMCLTSDSLLSSAAWLTVLLGLDNFYLSLVKYASLQSSQTAC